MTPSYVWQTHLGDGAPFDAAYHEVRRTDIASFITEPPGTVLDVGCAGGAMGRLIKEKFPGTRVIGIESNASAAAHASQWLDRVIAMPFEKIDPAVEFRDEALDVVLFLDVLEHLYDPWSALIKLRGFVSPHTRVLASIPNVRNLATLHELASGGWRYQASGVLDITHIRFFTLREMRALFEQTGFRVLTADPLTHPEAMTAIIASHVPGCIETKALRVNYASIAELEELFAIQYVIEARIVGLDSGGGPTAAAR